MSEISTRVWIEEVLWDQVRSRAVAEGVTVRDLIPRLVSFALGLVPDRPATPVSVRMPTSTAVEAEAPEPALPVVVLSDMYQCGVCGTQVKVGGLTLHMGKHIKERQAAEAERS